MAKLTQAAKGAEVIRQPLAERDRAETVEQRRSDEARAAADRASEHSRAFRTRSSPLTGSPRSAPKPANALPNYRYANLKAEGQIALLAVRFDPGMGVLHADLKARDSLALDLMEAVRPTVDAYVLKLLRSHTFPAGDFLETRQGVCRVLLPLTHLLAETAPVWANDASGEGLPIDGLVAAIRSGSSAWVDRCNAAASCSEF